MRKIEAIIREEKMQDVLDALTAAEITGITVYQVMGCGTQKGCIGIDAIMKSANTGHYGDGKIFAYDLDTVIRIRTGERGYDAINGSKVEE